MKGKLPRVRSVRRGRCRGYTLLEIALVVAIIVLLIGAAVPFTSGFAREQRFREVVRELNVYAKTARTDALTTGRPAEVVFARDGFMLRRPGDGAKSRTFKLPGDMRYFIIPFGTSRGLRPDGQRWVFQSSGLCEPLTVRLEEGEAWMEVTFDALTAGLADESYHIP